MNKTTFKEIVLSLNDDMVFTENNTAVNARGFVNDNVEILFIYEKEYCDVSIILNNEKMSATIDEITTADDLRDAIKRVLRIAEYFY